MVACLLSLHEKCLLHEKCHPSLRPLSPRPFLAIPALFQRVPSSYGARSFQSEALHINCVLWVFAVRGRLRQIV